MRHHSERARLTEYHSDVILGEAYLDAQTGFVGVATTVTFFQHACERVGLETYDAERREVKTEIFDAPRLTSKRTHVPVTAERTGGPGMPAGQRGPLGRQA